MNYLSLDNVVLRADVTELVFVKDETIDLITVEEDINKHNITITYGLSATYADLSRFVICKPWVYPTALCDIQPGSYLLYNEVVINGFHFAVSDNSLTKNFNQYVFTPEDLSYNDIVFDNDSINIKLTSTIVQSDYINLINESLLFFVLEVDGDAKIGTVTGVILERANKINVKSTRFLALKDERLLIEEADYITALILKLKAQYPRVQFYNADQDINDSKYTEFVRYRPITSTYQSDIVTTPVISDPIYGDVMTTTCQVDFEYHTTDFAMFNKRKFDYQINRFLSEVTTCDLRFPNTDRTMSFCVHWDRANTAEGYDFQMTTQLNEDGKSQYSFNSNVRLVVTIYRLAKRYPYIKRVILKTKIKVTNVSYKDEELIVE